MVKLLHIAFDSIFINYAIDQFESISPESNTYIIDVSHYGSELKFTNPNYKINYKVLSNSIEKDLLILSLVNYDAVIFHCLNTNMIDIINRAPSETKIIWIFWGAEANELPKLFRFLFQPKTKAILHKLNKYSIRKELYIRLPFLHYFLHKLKQREKHPDVVKLIALKRINYAATFVKEEYELLKLTYNLSFDWLWYNYFNIEQTVGEQMLNSKIVGRNILIGNSSDPKNNHVEIINLLSNMKIGNDSEIIIPLSYPENNSDYVNIIISYGQKQFGERFHPVTNFIPREEYNSLLQSCSIVIMNHNTQQAVGNIFTALWIGAKVYLNECNPVFNYLRRINLIVFSLQNDFKLDSQATLNSLKDSEVMYNRNVLTKYHSKTAVWSEINKFIEVIGDFDSALVPPTNLLNQ